MATTSKFKTPQYPPAFMIVLASIASAIVVTACGPENGDSATQAQSRPSAVQQQPQAAAPATPQQAPQQLATAAPRTDASVGAERQRPAATPNLGEVRGIRPIKSAPRATGAGAAIGGLAGGVLGHQVGSGRGNTVATVAGALGGAYAGHQVEKHRSEKVIGYRVEVVLDNGSVRNVRMAHLDGLRVGDRVRVDGKTQLTRV